MRAQMMERGRSDLKADLFIGVVVVSGVAVVASSLRHIFTDGLEARHLAWLGIAALTLLIGRLSVKLPFPNCRVSFSDALIFLSVLVYGGDFGTLTAALDGFASSTRQNGTAHKKAFNTAGMALSVHLSAWVFARLLPDGASSGHGLSPADLLLPVTALALSQYVLNTALVATAVALKDHASFLATWLGRCRLRGRLPGGGRGLPGREGPRRAPGVRRSSVPVPPAPHVSRLPGPIAPAEADGAGAGASIRVSRRRRRRRGAPPTQEDEACSAARISRGREGLREPCIDRVVRAGRPLTPCSAALQNLDRADLRNTRSSRRSSDTCSTPRSSP